MRRAPHSVLHGLFLPLAAAGCLSTAPKQHVVELKTAANPVRVVVSVPGDWAKTVAVEGGP